MSNKPALVYRPEDRTALCPKCYRFHSLYYMRDAVKPELVVLHPLKIKNTYYVITMPYKSIDGLPTYARKKTDYVFIKDGSFKIVKKSEYENQRLFE